MVSTKNILAISSLALLSITNAYAVSTFGAYTYGSDLDPSIRAEDGGAGFSSAAVNELTFGSSATIGGATYTPILKAWSESHNAPVDDDITQSKASAYQVYTSSISQTITLDLSLHGIESLDGTPLSLSQIAANIEVRGGSFFYVSDSYCWNNTYAFGSYLCGDKLGFKQLTISGGEETVLGSLSFDVTAGEQFSVFGHLYADSRDGSADAFHTFQTSFTDDTYIKAVVSAVPVPAAAWLFGSGLIALVGFAKRKK